MSKKAIKTWNEFQKPIKFEPNGFYEHLIQVRTKQPKVFEGMSPATKASLLAYEQAKRQAEVDREAAA